MICSGSSTTFDAGNAGASFVWSDKGTGTSESTPALIAGTYTVVVTNTNNCSTSYSATLTVLDKPIVSISNQSICAGESTFFDAGNAGATFAWSGMGTGTEQTSPASIAGIYTVNVSIAGNCSTSASATLTVNDLPVVNLLDQSICAGTTTTFDAGNAGATFLWSDLGTGIAQSTSALTEGKYTVTVTNSNNCQTSASAELQVNALPIIAMADQAICTGSSTTFDAGNAGATFLWSGMGTGNSQNTNAAAAGTYSVTVTNADNCTASGSAQLSLFSLPIVALRDSTICEGPSVLFDAGNLGSTYAWSDDAFGFAQKFNAQNSGVYKVTVTNTNHCSASSSATLTVNAIPTIAMVDQALCEGNATIFDAGNPGATFLWSGEGSRTEQTCPASASGKFSAFISFSAWVLFISLPYLLDFAVLLSR